MFTPNPGDRPADSAAYGPILREWRGVGAEHGERAADYANAYGPEREIVVTLPARLDEIASEAIRERAIWAYMDGYQDALSEHLDAIHAAPAVQFIDRNGHSL